MLLADRGFLGLKPPLGVTIKQGHPLAQGMIACFLANEGGGPIRDLVTGNSVPLVNAGAWGNAQFGQGLDCSGGNDAGAIATAWDLLKTIGNEVTLLWRGVIKATPANYSNFIGVSYTNSNTSPYQAYNLGSNTDSTKYDLFWNSGGFTNEFQATPVQGAWDGTERQVCAVLKGGASGQLQQIYEGPGLTSTGITSGSAGPNYTSNSQIGLGVYYNGAGRNANVIMRHGMIWNRILSPAEVAELFYHPYIFLESKYKRYFVPGPATSPLSKTASDQLPAWTEYFQVNNNQAAGLGVLPGDSFQLVDSISLQGPPPNYYMILGDRVNLFDFQGIVEGYPLRESDVLALTDKLNWWLVVLKSFSDTLALSDQLQTIPSGLRLAISDQLTALLDSVSRAKSIGISPTSNNFTFGDNVTLSDSFQAKFNTLMALSDTLTAMLEGLKIGTAGKLTDSMSLSDGVATSLTAFPSVTGTGADTFSFSDAVRTMLNLPWVRLTVTKNDTLALSDSVSVVSGLEYNESGFINRLRRYLNDLN